MAETNTGTFTYEERREALDLLVRVRKLDQADMRAWLEDVNHPESGDEWCNLWSVKLRMARERKFWLGTFYGIVDLNHESQAAALLELMDELGM